MHVENAPTGQSLVTSEEVNTENCGDVIHFRPTWRS